MKLIPLNTKRKCVHLDAPKFAIIDDEDYDLVMKYKWYAQKTKNTFYASSWIGKTNNPDFKKILMHRIILNPTENLLIDHIDHIGTNNQKYNLRICTSLQNQRNMKSHKDSTSKYVGVCFYKNRWLTQIGGRCIGRFPHTSEGEILAAKAYDKKAKELHGEFANLNFKE